ncbi:MAG TPA: acyl-CoA dehydrogenase, partial [Deltaproteobacteria bacterium]|nr:acyl-CoA dehydrogenase [Deltaproteobacteria bacterium]
RLQRKRTDDAGGTVDFGLTEEQDMLQETVRGFVQNECPTTRLRELFDEGSGHDPALWAALCEMGLAGLIVPEEQGGAGLELLDLALVAEVMGESALPGPFLGHSLAALGVCWLGSREQRDAILPALATGDRIATVALQESDSDWAPKDWTLESDAGRITGTKRIVPHAALADDLLVGLRGGGLAWVDARGEGVRIDPVEGVDRTRPFATVTFSKAPAERLTGGSGNADRLVEAASVLLAADAFGAASRLIDLDVAYAHSREQFGQPIGQFQAVKHAIARLGVEIEPARGLWWYAAHALDHLPEEAPRAASLAKAHITERATGVARESVELHGGYGFTWECEVQMWLKRIMFDRSFLGTPEQHRARCAELAGW